jgi:hypothetical protein
MPLINLQPSGGLPPELAWDAEVAAAIAAHEAKTDSHPNLWQRIVGGFLALAGGQRILKNNPPIANTSFFGGTNHLELATDNGSNPILAFHKGGISATSLHHAGYGDDSLRIRNADGMDAALIHDGNIGLKTAGNANNLLNLVSGWAAAFPHWDGTYRWRHLGGWVAGDDVILVHRAHVADRAANADFAGGITLDSGAPIRTRLIEGTTASVQGSSVSVAHGLDPTKILSMQVIVRAATGAIVTANNQNGVGVGHRFDSAIIGANLFIVNVDDQSVSLLSRPFSALINYRP